MAGNRSQGDKPFTALRRDPIGEGEVVDAEHVRHHVAVADTGARQHAGELAQLDDLVAFAQARIAGWAR
jgi:hypothetical protein